MDRGPWWAKVHGVAKSQTQLKWLSMHRHLRELPGLEAQRGKVPGRVFSSASCQLAINSRGPASEHTNRARSQLQEQAEAALGRRWYSQNSLEGTIWSLSKKKGTEKCSAFLVQGPGQRAPINSQGKHEDSPNLGDKSRQSSKLCGKKKKKKKKERERDRKRRQGSWVAVSESN